jgi:hypothetical protein
LWGAGRSFEKNTFILKGSDKVATTSWLAGDKEYILSFVRSILKKSVIPTIFTSTMTTRYKINLKYFSFIEKLPIVSP